MSYLCPGWWTEETGAAAAVVWPVCVCLQGRYVCPRVSCVFVYAAPPAPWRGGCVLVSEPRRAAGGPANQGSPEQNCSSRTGALLPSGGPEHTPTSGTHTQDTRDHQNCGTRSRTTVTLAPLGPIRAQGI